jgi:hypothetical protein
MTLVTLSHIAGEIAHRHLAMFDQLAQQHQPAGVADGLQRVGHVLVGSSKNASITGWVIMSSIRPC